MKIIYHKLYPEIFNRIQKYDIIKEIFHSGNYEEDVIDSYRLLLNETVKAMSPDGDLMETDFLKKIVKNKA